LQRSKELKNVALIALVSAGLMVVGCEEKKDASKSLNDAAKSAGDAAKDAANKTADATKAAADKAKDTAVKAADATKDAAYKAADATKEVAKDAANKTGDAMKAGGDKLKEMAGDVMAKAKDAAGSYPTELNKLTDSLTNIKSVDDATKAFPALKDQMAKVSGYVATLSAAPADMKATLMKDFKPQIDAAVSKFKAQADRITKDGALSKVPGLTDAIKNFKLFE
jgi:hypothetical protein